MGIANLSETATRGEHTSQGAAAGIPWALQGSQEAALRGCCCC